MVSRWRFLATFFASCICSEPCAAGFRPGDHHVGHWPTCPYNMVNFGPRLGLNSGPAAHSERHALLHMAPKWSSHWTTRAWLWSTLWPLLLPGQYWPMRP